jgi:glutaredoxin
MKAPPGARALLGLVLVVMLAGAASQWWHGRSQQRLGEGIAALAQRGDIRLLSSVTCGYCTRARAWLEEQAVPFDECFIEQDTACRSTFDALRAQGTPVLLVKGQAQTGFDPERVLQALKRRS